MDRDNENIAYLDLTGILLTIFWVTMDSLWTVFDLLVLPMLLSFPAIFLNLLLFRYSDKCAYEYTGNAAVLSWLLMNSISIYEDLFKWKSLFMAQLFTIAAIFITTCLTIYFGKRDGVPWYTALQNFRRSFALSKSR